MVDDTSAITHLLYRYAELLDAGDFTGVADLFVDADIAGGGTTFAHGSAGVRQMLESTVRIHDDGTPRTRHVISNPVVAFTDDGLKATATSTYTAFQQTDELPLQVIMVGRHRDEFTYADGRWKFTLRDYSSVDLIGDVSQHLLG